jgi:hypothetical protein
MPYRFFHLGVDFKEKTPSSDYLNQIEVVLNSAKDWYRYAPNCWIIYTGRTPKVWHERLKAIPWMINQRYLIVQIDVAERSGWLAKDTWDWIKKDRS